MLKNKNLKKALTAGATVLGSVATLAAYQSVAADHHVLAAPNGTTYDVNNPFLNKIAGPASELAGQNDLYASVMMAQAVLETGWGSSQLSQEPYNNLFGIKGSYNGSSVNFNTLEDDGSGNYYQINDGFRQYPSVRESLEDYVELIRGNPSLYSGVWKSNTNSYRDATAALTGTYATDTSYGSKLNNIIETYDLTRFDEGPVGEASAPSTSFRSATPQVQTFSADPSAESTSGGNSYTVKAGDGLWTVARALGVSVDQVKQANGLTSDFIYPGQVLYAGGQQASSQSSQSASASSASESGQTTTSANSGNSYTVQAGDGLWTVARALGVSVDQVKQANGLTSDFIYPGQVLYAAGQQTSSQSSQSAGASSASEGGETTTSTNSGNSYTVQAGDGLWTVARALGVSVDQVKQANGLTSDFIYPGQVLYAGSGASSTTTAQDTPTATDASANTQATAAPTASQSQADGEFYTVKSGDTQWHIATTHGLTLAQFQALNGFSDVSLYIGQQVRVSGQAPAVQPTETSQSSSSTAQEETQEWSAQTVDTKSTEATQTEQETQESNSNGGTYTIKAGDNLYRIALNHNVSLDALLEANGFGSPDALILPGQVLTIPAQ